MHGLKITHCITLLTALFDHAILYLKVLELGIVVHSVIIGMSLGASESVSTIKPLVAALAFHQFFEGIGLGGCIVQVCRPQQESLIPVIYDMCVYFATMDLLIF